MAWTLPTAIFFVAIFASVLGMTLWEINSPSPTRRGLLGFTTTRGDRFFMCLLSTAIIHILWLALVDIQLIWAGLACFCAALFVMRYG